MAKFPAAISARAEIRYLDRGALFPAPFHDADRHSMPALTREFDEFSRELLNDQIYPKRPSPRCRWCHFRANGPNGGPCDVVA